MIKHISIINIFLAIFFVLPTNCKQISLVDMLVFGALSYCEKPNRDFSKNTIFNHYSKGCSVGLEYTLDDQTKNPWGDLKITANYTVTHRSSSIGDGKARFYLFYENVPGCMGKWGNIGGKIEATHSNTIIDSAIKLTIPEINTILSYNPEVIRKLDRFLVQETQFQVHQQAILEKNSQNHEKLKKELDKKIFVEKKKAFALRPANPNDQNYREIQDMLQQIEENLHEK